MQQRLLEMLGSQNSRYLVLPGERAGPAPSSQHLGESGTVGLMFPFSFALIQSW